ncbi:MAG: dTMP kinase [Gammaproteobacteria bacterium]|nr:dTMP kinase [Gammaproteobacteria bacterium]MDE2261356.1 dTMP kinase [Gammaproteobacteria bacterium]
MARGLFITLEGIEGAGKSTVARGVCEWLGRQSIRATLTREPGGTALAERVRQIVLERGQERLSAVTETLLMFAARAIHLENLIRPALERGDWVVCDRFTDATRAYQGGGRGVDAAWIESLAGQVHGGLQPDCTLLLDLPVPIGLQRARSRQAGAVDRFEAEAQVFFERVRAAYLELARREPQRIHVIDASLPLEAVQQQVAAVLGRLSPLPDQGRAP